MTTYDTFLFTGHGLDFVNSYDPGATYNGIEEHVIAEMITDEVQKLLLNYNLKIQYGEQNFKKDLLKGNEYNYKRGLSIHINSSSSNASGTELLVPCQLSSLDYERELLKEISEQLQIRNRGLKSRDYDTGDFITRTENKPIHKRDYYKEIRLAQEVGIDLSILEVGFIQTDIPTIKNNLKEIAQIITEYYLAFTHATIKPSEGKEVFFRVVTGSFKERSNAEKQVQQLKELGFTGSFITTYEK